MTVEPTSPIVTQLDGEPVEIKVTADMIKRGLIVKDVSGQAQENRSGRRC